MASHRDLPALLPPATRSRPSPTWAFPHVALSPGAPEACAGPSQALGLCLYHLVTSAMRGPAQVPKKSSWRAAGWLRKPDGRLQGGLGPQLREQNGQVRAWCCPGSWGGQGAQVLSTLKGAEGHPALAEGQPPEPN